MEVSEDRSLGPHSHRPLPPLRRSPPRTRRTSAASLRTITHAAFATTTLHTRTHLQQTYTRCPRRFVDANIHHFPLADAEAVTAAITTQLGAALLMGVQNIATPASRQGHFALGERKYWSG